MEARHEASVPSNLKRMLPRIQGFINDTLCNEDVDDDLYIEGSVRIDFYADRIRPKIDLHIEECDLQHNCEDALYERLSEPRPFNLTVLLGGLGAGKTTTVKYMVRRLIKHAQEFAKEYKCDWDQCLRTPISLDFRDLSLKSALDVGSVVSEVFRRMRLAVYKRIIEQWLRQNGNDIARIARNDKDFVCLRRLLIVNDLLQSGERLTLSDLFDSRLELEEGLLNSSFSDEELVKLIEQRKKDARVYEKQIQRVTQNSTHSRDFMSTILRFYQSTCHTKNPMNLIVLDNLDQLPTPQIEELLQELHDLATAAEGLPLLTPFRPSSIGPNGYIRPQSFFRHHYGPNNFRMVLSRLERHILTQSRKDLAVVRTKENHKPFPTTPTDTEIDALLVIAYLYARIMSKGVSESKKESSPKDVTWEDIKTHPDHSFLKRIRVGQGSLLGLAQTSDALVGVCCRYGLDLMRRYFENAYDNPYILREAIRLRSDSNLGRQAIFTYADLIACLLRDPPMSDAEESRIANLFDPTTVSGNHWPSLIKLRILSLLVRKKRQSVRHLDQQLVLMGIPTELTIEALNHLQNKFRLLLWFSTNQPLSTKDPASLNHDVVISEHGERYFRRVVGDFDYVWFCGTALYGRPYTYRGPKFTVKLSDYKVLIERVGKTEWKQIGFSRLRKDAKADVGGVGHANQMEVLNVLYSSLGRALVGADITMRVHDETIGLVEELLPLVKEVCSQILFWQKRYEIAYGSNFYISMYEDRISDLKDEITRLQATGSEPLELLKEFLSAVQSSWLIEEQPAPVLDLMRLDEISRDQLMGFLERYGRGTLPGLREWVATLDMGKRVNVFKERLVRELCHLAHLLESRIPTYTEVKRLVGFLLNDLNEVITREADDTMAGGMLRWCLNEQAFLQSMKDILEDNAYVVPSVCSKEEMSELKMRSNNIMAAVRDLARHLGVNANHLGAEWHDRV
jgi:Cdc6-like AAA superfamily ATPase